MRTEETFVADEKWMVGGRWVGAFVSGTICITVIGARAGIEMGGLSHHVREVLPKVEAPRCKERILETREYRTDSETKKDNG